MSLRKEACNAHEIDRLHKEIIQEAEARKQDALFLARARAVCRDVLGQEWQASDLTRDRYGKRTLSFTLDNIRFQVRHVERRWGRYSWPVEDVRTAGYYLAMEVWHPRESRTRHLIWGPERRWIQVSSLAEVGQVLRRYDAC